MAGYKKPQEGRAGEVPSDAHGFPAQDRQQAAFLVEASRLLAESLDYETTLETVAGLSLPHLGAWCIVDILEEAAQEEQAAVRGEHHKGVPRQEESESKEGAAATDDGRDWGPGDLTGGMRRLSIVHREPSKQRLVNQLMESSLVDSVLNFARIDSGQVEFACTDVELSDVFDHVEAVLRPIADEHGIPYPDPCDGRHVVHAEPEKVQHILINLVKNAIKFTPPHGEVVLECEEDEDRVYVRVRDTGAGVAEENQDRIFERFVQVEEGLPRERSGTGLGLAIARKLARGMGGDITLRSTLGEGSEFTLSLPQGDSSGGEPGHSH